MRNLRKVALVAGLAAAALAFSGVAAAKQPGSGGTTTTTTTASVRILAPFYGTAVIPWKGFTFIGSITDPNGAGLGACEVSWGDGTSDVVSGAPISATTSNCATAHAYTSSGFYYITTTGSDVNGYVGASSAVLVVVF